jgi:hypothetical protein
MPQTPICLPLREAGDTIAKKGKPHADDLT